MASLFDQDGRTFFFHVRGLQNFEPGFLDEQLDRLTEVLKLRRIWGLNVGENFGVSMPAVRTLCSSPVEHVKTAFVGVAGALTRVAVVVRAVQSCLAGSERLGGAVC